MWFIFGENLKFLAEIIKELHPELPIIPESDRARDRNEVCKLLAGRKLHCQEISGFPTYSEVFLHIVKAHLLLCVVVDIFPFSISVTPSS